MVLILLLFKPISRDNLYFYHLNNTVYHKDSKLQFSKLSSGPLNNIQISSLPSLMYFLFWKKI